MIILACEGPSEVYLVESLIKNGHLHFKSLFLFKPIRMRQLKEQKHLINSMTVDTPITVFRIGDTLKDKLDTKGFEIRKPFIKSFKFCTKTEIEILIIINENLLKEYNKHYRKQTPKDFLKHNRPGLDIHEYFDTHDMADSIYKYRSLKSHKRGELYLADMLDADKCKDMEEYFRNS